MFGQTPYVHINNMYVATDVRAGLGHGDPPPQVLCGPKFDSQVTQSCVAVGAHKGESAQVQTAPALALAAQCLHETDVRSPIKHSSSYTAGTSLAL